MAAAANSTPSGSASASMTPLASASLYVGDLDENVTEPQVLLYTHYSSLSDATLITLVIKSDDHKARGHL